MVKFIYRALDITAGYGKKIVLKDLSLDLEQGSCTFIIGANGCGKSTLFSVLAGIKKARSGQFLIEGKEAGEKQRQRMTGYAPQESPLFFELSVKDNLLLWYGGKEAVETAADGGIIEKLGLRELLKKRAGTLSGGQLRRVCIACAMAGNPRILIMDEPGTALDLECKEILQACLREYRKAGGTVLMSSHEKADWEMGDHVYLLSDGKLQEKDMTGSS